MTVINEIRAGRIPEVVARAAENEPLSPEELAKRIESGKAVVLYSSNHEKCRPLAVGAGTRIKVNANIGASPDDISIDGELEKLAAALKAGADAVMDLSIGGDIRAIRKKIIENSDVPLGTVPLYQACSSMLDQDKGFIHMTPDELFKTIEQHGEDGVSFVTVHCGVTRNSTSHLLDNTRLLGVVSRGGAFTCKWMEYNDAENPLFEQFDRLLEIALKYDMTLSIGDGLRPGCLADATDSAQITELVTIGELCKQANKAGVQAMVEGPGHVPLDQVVANVQMQKALTGDAPFYVLGPLVTDIAAGYDHIAGAIGGALAGMHGADFLCYVTPSEHLRLPDAADVFEGVMASRIAAHAGDIAKGLPGARDRDDALSRARRDLDWDRQFELVIDPEKAKRLRASTTPAEDDTCTMCGKFCAIKVQKPEEQIVEN